MKHTKSPMVTVVIPVYNCEAYLQECLDSVYAQTYDNYDIIAINDGSTDSSLSILEKNAKIHQNLRIIDQENSGQGHARNAAVKLASGKYIQFLDSDDKLEPLTLELAVTRGENDDSDIVHYDWKWSSMLEHRPAAFLYLNQEPFSHKAVLEGAECDELMQLWHYYTVNNLYNRTFLIDNSIEYGEGRIYEDIIFIVLTANRAQRVSILHSPLYIVRRNMESSSRSGYEDDRHAVGYIRAVKNALEVLEPRTEQSVFYLVKYLLTKFVFYYAKRVPRQYRHQFLRDFVDALSDVTITIPDGHEEKFMRVCVDKRVFAERKYRLLELLIQYKTKALPARDKTKKKLKQAKHVLAGKRNTAYIRALAQPVEEGLIVFLGFDFRYTGNSRYLFDELVQDARFEGKRVLFATDDERVAERYRVEPKSKAFFEAIGRAEILIAESWMPGYIKKRDDAIVVQLWHGTAIKKLLFDSNESEILQRNPKYKIGKHWNLTRWDYLLSDSPAATKKFQSAFLLPEHRIIQAGYPRVKFLIDNHSNHELKQTVKDRLGLGGKLADKKIVLYAPTWRDYNYRLPPEEQDLDYVLDIRELADSLGDEYLVIYNDHHFLSTMPDAGHPRCINVSGNESQELLLVADAVISDYSSIIFDAFAIDIPVLLYANDQERYQKSRGVYIDVWQDLKPLIVSDVGTLTKRVKQVTAPKYKLATAERELYSKYAYKSSTDLAEFIAKLNSKTIQRDW